MGHARIRADYTAKNSENWKELPRNLFLTLAEEGFRNFGDRW